MELWNIIIIIKAKDRVNFPLSKALVNKLTTLLYVLNFAPVIYQSYESKKQGWHIQINKPATKSVQSSCPPRANVQRVVQDPTRTSVSITKNSLQSFRSKIGEESNLGYVVLDPMQEIDINKRMHSLVKGKNRSFSDFVV